MIPVIWKDAVNATADGNTLEKTGGTDATWNAGAISVQYLESGDGYIEATIDQSNINVIFGFSKGDVDQNYPDIDFAFYIHSSAKTLYFKNGANITETSTGFINIGDVVRIEISGTDILLKKNGVAWHTDSNTLTSSNYPLLVDTSLHGLGARLNNVVLEGFEDIEPVVWQDVVNVSTTNNDLQKTSGTDNNWNAGAISVQSLISGNGYVECVADETNKHRMFGLSKGDVDQSHSDIDFAIQLRDNATLEVRLNGTTVSTGTAYVTDDVLRVEVSGNDVLFKKNGAAFHSEVGALTSSSYPLLVDTSIYHTNGTLKDVVVQGFLTHIPVEWTNAVNVTVSDNNLTKASGGEAWNAGAVSAQQLTSGDGYVETTVEETNGDRRIGLSQGDNDQSAVDIDYQFMLDSSGNLRVFEGATQVVANAGSYATGDTLRVEVVGTDVLYKQNSVVLHTSSNVINTNSYPLLVDVSLWSVGDTLKEVIVQGFEDPPEPTLPQVPVRWKNTVNVSFVENDLDKISGGSGWNAGGVSQQMLLSGDGYVETTVAETNTSRMIGLSKGDTDQNHPDIDYALYIVSTVELRVYLNGVNTFTEPSYSVGDVLRVEVSGADVLFKKNGLTFYTVSNTIDSNSYPLLVDTSLFTDGATLKDVVVSGFEDPLPSTISAKPVKWINQVNVSASANHLQKTSGSDNAWNAGAVSAQRLYSGDGFVETTLKETNLYRMIGLSTDDTDQNYTDTGYAFHMSYIGELTARVDGLNVSGSNKPTYVYGDTVRVEISGNNVLYKHNGVVFHTEAGVIDENSYPLMVDTSLYDLNATLKDVVVSEKFEEVAPLQLPKRLVQWVNISNICIEGQRMEKIAGADAWDAGTVSAHSIAYGNCYVETVVVENSKARMLGLSKGDSGYGNDIDFAASLHSDGTFRVYEGGIEVGSFGHYNVGDVVRVEINGDSVFYRVNGDIRKANFGVIDSSNYPLLVDVSMKGIGTILQNVWIGAEAFPPRQTLTY